MRKVLAHKGHAPGCTIREQLLLGVVAAEVEAGNAQSERKRPDFFAVKSSPVSRRSTGCRRRQTRGPAGIAVRSGTHQRHLVEIAGWPDYYRLGLLNRKEEPPPRDGGGSEHPTSQIKEVKSSLSTRPETQQMALQWERTKRRYLSGGLCHKCAAQAAWAHQPGAGGWTLIRPPCPACAELMAAAFPYATTNPLWRSVLRKRR